MLARCLHEGGASWAEAWNFGPGTEGAATVAELVDLMTASWGRGSWRAAPADPAAPPESAWLALNSGKARRRLGWHPVLSLREAVALTVAWYQAAQSAPPGRAVFDLSRDQIHDWTSRVQPASAP
jgi:CDP-glucose 4,6-dehydratase